MPGAERAEIYFIAGMMLLILVLCAGAVFFFIKTYKKEMRDRSEQLQRNEKPIPEGENATS